MNPISSYRQPMVTATGILLGFILDFATRWETGTGSKSPFRETVVGMGLLACTIILLIVLYRILNMNFPQHDEPRYYRSTLHLFIMGISIPFATILIIAVERLLL